MMMRLPEDIQVYVFLRLPAKSIVSCRCVCKPWCRLLCNPEFIKDHVNNTSNRNPRLMLMAYKGGKKLAFHSTDYASILSSSSASASASAATCTCDGAIYPMDFFFEGQWYYYDIKIIGSCNGLICMCLPDMKFCIWNPSTGEYKIISCDWHTKSWSSYEYGFGYDSEIDDYKVVIILANEKSGYSKVEVYTLGLKSLKTERSMKGYKNAVLSKNVICFLNGALHWTSFIEATRSRVVVSFDISKERFVDFAYPEEVSELQKRDVRSWDSVGLLQDHLCLIIYDNNSTNPHFDVWLMQDYGETESWTKQFSFEAPLDTSVYSFKPVWSFMNGEVLIDSVLRRVVYDPKNETTKVLEICEVDSKPLSYVVNLVSYVESLASVNSGTFVMKSREIKY